MDFVGLVHGDGDGGVVLGMLWLVAVTDSFTGFVLSEGLGGARSNGAAFGGMLFDAGLGRVLFDAALSGVIVGAALGRFFFIAAPSGMLFEAA
jgi:hypothetical protein